jgi:hypothetical protein
MFVEIHPSNDSGWGPASACQLWAQQTSQSAGSGDRRSGHDQGLGGPSLDRRSTGIISGTNSRLILHPCHGSPGHGSFSVFISPQVSRLSFPVVPQPSSKRRISRCHPLLSRSRISVHSLNPAATRYPSLCSNRLQKVNLQHSLAQPLRYESTTRCARQAAWC